MYTILAYPSISFFGEFYIKMDKDLRGRLAHSQFTVCTKMRSFLYLFFAYFPLKCFVKIFTLCIVLDINIGYVYIGMKNNMYQMYFSCRFQKVNVQISCQRFLLITYLGLAKLSRLRLSCPRSSSRGSRGRSPSRMNTH